MIFLLKHNLERLIGASQPKMIVGVSGGKDSMALLTALAQLGLDVTAVHINYQLRGESSLLDEICVNDYCTQLMCPIIIHRAEKQSDSGNTQDWARKVRFEIFEKVRQDLNADWIVLAHHLQDLQESQWLKFLRHSIDGLQGMDETRDFFLRPMLHINRSEIENFVIENKIPFRDDQSNFENKYNRNWLRNELIPQVKERFPSSDQAIVDFQINMSQQNDWMEWLIQQWMSENVIKEDNIQFLPATAIPSTLPTQWILYRWLKPFGFSSKLMERMATLAQMPRGTFFSSQDHQVSFDQQCWILTELQETKTEHWQGSEFPASLECNGEHWTFEWQDQVNPSLYGQEGIHQLDGKALQPPFEIRRWENGDLFQPLGMSGQMKVADFLNQKKVATHHKRKVSVLIAQNKIAAILGWQIADGYKIQQNSGPVLVIRQGHPPTDPSLL
jgi:tRNA(Ile)-lysidine synthase